MVICECSSRGCVERVSLTRREYEHVRADGVQFFVVAGHENLAVGAVVEMHLTHLVVKKIGVAGVDAERTDPRDENP